MRIAHDVVAPRGLTRALSGVIALGVVAVAGSRIDAQQYPTYPELEATLQSLGGAHPDIAALQSIGTSHLGRDMWAMCITDNVGIEEDEPELRYISTMHGDEVMGVVLCLRLISHLLDQYGIDPRITELVDAAEIWIIPCMNPDGYVAGTRYNAQGIDLNRDFPCLFTSPENTPVGRAPETANVMNFCFEHSFTLAANFHGGALVANYPFDANTTGSSVYTPTPDDDMFIWISEEYARHNLPMWNSPVFYHGITNGADWYVIYGGMQDWTYRYLGGNEVTIEVSNNKQPPPSQIPAFWEDNRESMLSYLETSLIGLRGMVTDAVTSAPLAARIRIVGRDHDVYTDPDVGDYHRMLLPGVYDVELAAESYDPLAVLDVAVPPGAAARLDAGLFRTTVVHPDGGEVLAAGEEVLVEWTGAPMARFQVQYTPDADALDVAEDGFETGALGAAYETGGSAPWYVTTGVVHGGSFSARSGTITHDQSSWLRRSFGGGTVGFWYRVDSESGYDFFDFQIDGQTHLHRSGSVAWMYFELEVADGAHELAWTYSKDYSVSQGADAAWIDDVSMTTDTTEWHEVGGVTDVGATSVWWTPLVAGDNQKVRVRAEYDDGADGLWDESDGVFAVVVSAATGDADEDGDVDFADFAPFQRCCRPDAGATCMEKFDFDGSAGIDVDDFAEFLNRYTGPQ